MKPYACRLTALLAVLFAVTGCIRTAPGSARITPATAVPPNTQRAAETLTPLDTYVHRPDPHFAYKLVSTDEGDDWTGYVLELTSQQWRSPEEVDRAIWKHWLIIIRPEKVEKDTAMLLIGGGSNRDRKRPPRAGDALLRQLAAATHSVTAKLLMVPNQRVKFADNERSMAEDTIIAYTWDKFLRTGDAEWLLRMPMTKSAVKAMDAMQMFCASEEFGRAEINDFVVAGASKRGWTTWTTTAVDRRVTACIPMVIDLLNIIPSFEHHWAVYGFWAPAINDYVNFHIMDWMQTPEYRALMKVVEPYSYRDRLTMPKYLVNAAGDQFFLPDSWRFYLDDLLGPTYIRYVPNAGHGLNADAARGISAFYHGIVVGDDLPEYEWAFVDDNTVRVTTPDTPVKVTLWQATNPEARDFRIDVLGPKYEATPLADQGGGVFEAHVATPEQGWTAYLVELRFEGPGEAPYVFSTPVRIVPDELPYKYVAPQNPPTGFLSEK